MPSLLPLPLRWLTALAAVVALALTRGAPPRHTAVAPLATTHPVVAISAAESAPTSATPRATAITLGDTLLGLSGKLRVHFVRADDLTALVGDESPSSDGIYPVPGGVDGRPFAFVALHDFSNKTGAFIGRYHTGFWPAERRAAHSKAYANPTGFIEVTPANEDTYVSEHFRLRDFLTHDQEHVWPKYIVLREALLDKLELVLDDLALRGIPTWRVVVLSGFRTPSYNLALGDASGRARESRHEFGDAADIIIDADGDGRMDDLNMDGRIDAGDVRVIEQAVERVERAYPSLAGGLGLYESMGPHGPFAHIDVRGEVARWTRIPHLASAARATSVARCYATGPSAVLCAHVR